MPQEEMNHESPSELPTVVLRKTKKVSDWTVEELDLECKGLTMDEALRGIKELLRLAKEEK